MIFQCEEQKVFRYVGFDGIQHTNKTGWIIYRFPEDQPLRLAFLTVRKPESSSKKLEVEVSPWPALNGTKVSCVAESVSVISAR